MKKMLYQTDTYWVGENGVYLELTNTKEFIDSDGIKRIVFELKDKNKIDKIIGNQTTSNHLKNKYAHIKTDIDNPQVVDIPDI